MTRNASRSAVAQTFVGVLVVAMVTLMFVNFRHQVMLRALDSRRQLVMSAEGSASDAADLASCNELYLECERFLTGPGRLLKLAGRDCGPPCGE
jgi:hypothetical protein